MLALPHAAFNVLIWLSGNESTWLDVMPLDDYKVRADRDEHTASHRIRVPCMPNRAIVLRGGRKLIIKQRKSALNTHYSNMPILLVISFGQPEHSQCPATNRDEVQDLLLLQDAHTRVGGSSVVGAGLAGFGVYHHKRDKQVQTWEQTRG